MNRQDQSLPKKSGNFEDLQKFQAKLVSRLSSELNTPLSIIREGLDLLSEEIQDQLKEKDKKLLNVLHENVNRLTNGLNHFFELCRIEAGQMDFKRKSLDVNEFLKEVEKEFEKVVKARKLRWQVRPLPKNALIYGNAQYLLEVFKHLVDNAVKFTEKGAVEVTVKDDPKHVEFIISDTGMGISEEHRLKVFDKFEQHWPDPNRPPEGLGLGLTIAKAIVNHHQGRIWIDEKYQKGTRVIFTIPKLASKSTP
ncbi:MAG: HAMP domain-containing histidine kinase [Candidatus Omnitrophica bacterium]|nr:HAMP domain-containing histidine kinase [Candidatus Omnitrophota bacterium]